MRFQLSIILAGLGVICAIQAVNTDGRTIELGSQQLSGIRGGQSGYCATKWISSGTPNGCNVCNYNGIVTYFWPNGSWSKYHTWQRCTISQPNEQRYQASNIQQYSTVSTASCTGWISRYSDSSCNSVDSANTLGACLATYQMVSSATFAGNCSTTPFMGPF